LFGAAAALLCKFGQAFSDLLKDRDLGLVVGGVAPIEERANRAGEIGRMVNQVDVYGRMVGEQQPVIVTAPLRARITVQHIPGRRAADDHADRDAVGA
jgi:hypothetical protein